jgi:3-oxoacyl-[acyl-carrier protein] reductase
MIDTGLSGKVVLVTGANHGIGAATARAFAAEGAAVFIHSLRLAVEPSATGSTGKGDATAPGEAMYRARQAMPADEVVEDIRRGGGRAEAWEADLADPATTPQLFDRAEAAFGPAQVLVNNAARGEPDSFIAPSLEPRNPHLELWTHRPDLITAESHDRHFDVNSRAVALMMAEYARRHIERGARWGRIVNVSTDGAPGFSGEVSYGASKYALESYSRAAAKELGRWRITVNIVSPGPIQTGYITAELEEKLLPSIPLGRLGQPEDVADVIVFLASEQARWITGQVVQVGGGHRMI